MFNTIPILMTELGHGCDPIDDDPILQALAHYIQQQYPHHRIKTDYSCDNGRTYPFLKIWSFRDRYRNEQPATYCYVNHEDAIIAVIGQNFTVEINIDLTDPDSITQFDRALRQLMVAI